MENLLLYSYLLCYSTLLLGCTDSGKPNLSEESYSISGCIIDEQGDGLVGINIKAGNKNIYSDESGNWAVSNLKGSITVTPLDINYKFTPASASVSSKEKLVFVASRELTITTPYVEKVTEWFEQMQLPNGLLASVESGNIISLYDNALAALVFIATKKYAKAEAIFDYFNKRIVSELCSGNGGFYQFRSTDDIPNGDRWLGDNAWLLIALNNYSSYVNSDKYFTLKTKLERWIRSLQDSDGGLWGGITVNNTIISKNTEGMIDSYCAVSGYDGFHKKLLNYLKENRFDANNQLFISWPNNYYQYALDNHSWGYCTFEDFPKSILDKTDRYINTQRATANNCLITGFAPDIDKDIVWLEGTGQMIVAYQKANDTVKASTYLTEMTKLLIHSSLYPHVLGLPYSSNLGTTYGSIKLWDGADTNICISSSAWYLFAMLQFDPMAIGYNRSTPDKDKFWLNK